MTAGRIGRGEKTGEQEAGNKSTEFYSCSKYLWNTYHVSGITLGAGNTPVSKKDKTLISVNLWSVAFVKYLDAHGKGKRGVE